ncbi:MAG: TPM domain-containing protein, partial [Verrucomicrobiota bacterium]|nr:TPM domain-containing protein [Verrucomicrobiota bacterium]
VLAASLGFGAWGLGFLRPRVLPAALILATVFLNRAAAAEVIPPKPPAYFNDYASVVSKEKARVLNEKLAQFERETSNQVVVAVFRKMQSDSSIEDYAQRIAQAWGVGQKSQSGGNGVVLLVFIDDRKMSIQVGYGLEGTLPDVTAFDIRSRHINPHFKNGDYEGGLEEGIDLICKAIRGEYKGDGETALEKRRTSGASTGCGPLGFLVMLIVVLVIIRLGRRKGGYGYTGLGGPFISSGWGSGWSSGSSPSSGGGFSGFSGGGGSFGGGGSSGGW